MAEKRTSEDPPRRRYRNDPEPQQPRCPVCRQVLIVVMTRRGPAWVGCACKRLGYEK